MMQKYRYSLILLRELVITEFKLRYQGSVLGYVWSLLRPLFLFVILYVVFVYFLKVGHDVPHWPVALLLGIVLWNFFAETTNVGITSVVNRGDVIRKINFPKYVIVLASSFSALVNLLINMVIIIIFMLIDGVGFSWTMLAAPIYVVELFLFALGIAFFLGAVFVRLRDVNYIWEIIMQGLFYGSIVIYPVQMVLDKGKQLTELLLLNPVAQSIQDIRYSLISHDMPTLITISKNFTYMFVPLGITLTVFVFGAWYFKKHSASFAENV
jgi:ABC-2 type transport system permease protein